MAILTDAERERTESLLADEYLNDLVYAALLERGEPSKVSEITLEIGNSRIAAAVVRRAVSESPRFLTIDRQWDLVSRYVDQSRPTERNLAEVLTAAGRPLSTAQIATELSIIYKRYAGAYLPSAQTAVQNTRAYFKTQGNEYGLNTWLPLTDGENEGEVFADNKLTAPVLSPYRKASEKVQWTPTRYADATFRLVEAAKRPVAHKVLGVLAWLTLGEKYNALAHMSACLSDARLVWLTGRGGGRWITRAHADRLEALLEARAASLGAEEPEEVTPVVAPVTTPPTPVEEAAPVEETPPPVVEAAPIPLAVTDEDLTAIEQIVSERGTPIEASELLALRYEVMAGDKSYRSDVETLQKTLEESDRFLYVGAGRFREANSLPLFVFSIPEFLSFPDLQFISMDGEIMDEEIEDEGLASPLRAEMKNPLAQDAGDDEGEYTGDQLASAASIRLVVKAHHKDIGTFPLCQVPDGFFPTDAPVVEIAVRDPNGEAHDIVVNNNERLCFNWFGLYEFLGSDAGAVFHLHRTARPWEFRFEPDAEPDAQVGVSSERIADLQSLREQAEETGDMATFDLTCEILAAYPKGLDFVETMSELNIVRRVTRRKLASILSIYQCFMQKPGQPQWRFDPKKRELGTDRAKRKYMKR